MSSRKVVIELPSSCSECGWRDVNYCELFKDWVELKARDTVGSLESAEPCRECRDGAKAWYDLVAGRPLDDGWL